MRPYVYIPVDDQDVLIDREDYSWVRYLFLSVQNGYVYASGRERLHRLVRGLKPNDNMLVDHVNGNKLDNRKVNLRICSTKDNTINRKPNKRRCHSYYKGVSRTVDKGLSKEWYASIKHGKRNVYLGYWETEVEAAMAYDKASLKFNPGIPLKLNFPNQKCLFDVPNVDYDIKSRKKVKTS